MESWWVYVIQSKMERVSSSGKALNGAFYVGMTNDPPRRLRQHNGEIKGGARCTSGGRPWVPRALFGPYSSRSEALRAERSLKKSKRGESRTRWSESDSPLCRGLGINDPWVADPVSPWRLRTHP